MNHQMNKSDKINQIERLLPQDIEKRSFEIIGEELNKSGIVLPEVNESVIQSAGIKHA